MLSFYMPFRVLLALFFLLIVSGLPRRAGAQGAFRAGYILPLDGDTIRGKVQVRGAMRSASECRFRSTATAASTDYAPAQLRGYGIAGVAIYRTQLVPAVGAEAAILLFVKVLVTGKATLYTRQDRDDQPRYYLAMGTDSLQELRQFRVQTIVDNQVLYEEKSPFRTVLAKAFRDCLLVQPLLPRLALAATDLAKVVVRYNQCAGGPAALIVAPRERAHLGLGVVGGLAASRVKFSEQLAQLHDGSFVSQRPVAGLFVVFTSPQLNRRLALRLDILYAAAQYQDAYVARSVASTVEVRNQASITWRCLRVPLQVRYHFTAGQLRPFLLAGASASYLLSSSSYLRSEYTSAAGSPVVSERVALRDDLLVRAEYGLLAGVGIATAGLVGHAIGLELRAEGNSGFAANGLAPTMHVAALASINLTK